MDGIRARHDRLEVLVSNVAFGAPVKDVDGYSRRALHAGIDYSAWPIVTHTLAARALFGRAPRYVVGVSSEGAETMHVGYDLIATAKAVLETLCRYLHYRLREEGTSVNVVRTRFVDTESLAATFGEEFARVRPPLRARRPVHARGGGRGHRRRLLGRDGRARRTGADRRPRRRLVRELQPPVSGTSHPSHSLQGEPMTREEVLAVVAKHLANAVDGLDATTIDPTRSMKDYGANSLDIVEVVSGAMRELKVKVPRAELNKLTNIDGLVGLLHDIKSSTQQVTQ